MHVDGVLCFLAVERARVDPDLLHEVPVFLRQTVREPLELGLDVGCPFEVLFDVLRQDVDF